MFVKASFYKIGVFLFVPLLVALLMSSLLTSTNANATDVSRDQIKGLDEQVQAIKSDVLDLSSELSLLEEKLLFPSSTQVSLFVSLAEDENFELDSLQIKINNKVVTQHLYTFKELEALRAGGVQRIYTGNIKTGEHDLKVSYIGRDASQKSVKRSANYKITKAVGPKIVEIQVSNSENIDKAVRFKDW